MQEGDGGSTKGTMRLRGTSNVTTIDASVQQEVQGTELIK
jgi:hypothetical protein